MSKLNRLLHVKPSIYYIYTGDNEQLQSIAMHFFRAICTRRKTADKSKTTWTPCRVRFNVLSLLNSFIILQQETRRVYKMLFAEKENFEGWQIGDG